MHASAQIAAHALPCPHCGGIFPVDGLADELRCPYCMGTFALDSVARARLAGYQQQVQAALADAGEHLGHVRAWQQAADPSRVRKLNILVLGGFAALLMVGALAAALLLLLDLEQMIGWLTIVIPLGFVAIVLVVVVISSRAPQKAQASAGSHTVACPSCGAPNRMRVGDALERCRFCRGALVASKEVVEAGIDAADAVRHAAMFDRHRLERQGTAQAMRHNATHHYLALIVFGSLALPLGIGTLAMTNEMLFGSEPLSLAGLFAMWGMLCAVLTAGMVVWQLHRLRKARYERVLDDLAVQIGGQRTASVFPVVEWLNHYWATEYDLAWLRAGAYHGAAFGHVHGLPCLIHLDLHSADSHHKPHAILVVASWLSASRDRLATMDPNARACIDWLERAGFGVRIDEGGVLASANDSTLKIIRREPTLAHMLITVLTTLSGLSRILRGQG
jgi:predicted lipid-binding transport protein (Tim44 family)